MGDRRVGDRREKQRGVINVKFKDAAIILIVAVTLIVSLSSNIILASKYKKYKTYFYQVLESSDYTYSEDSKNPNK